MPKTISQVRLDIPTVTPTGTDLLLADQTTQTVAITLNEIKTFVRPEVATSSLGGILSDAQAVKLSGIAPGATVNQSDSALLDRSNHTGTQVIATIVGLKSSLNSKAFQSTSALAGLDLTINVNTAEFNISSGTAVFATYTDPAAPTAAVITYSAVTGVAVTNIATSKITFVGVNAAGAIFQQATPFTNTQKSTIVQLGILYHPANEISYIAKTNLGSGQSYNQFSKALEALGAFTITGGEYFPSTSLTFSRTAGAIYSFGATDNQVAVSSQVTAGFIYKTATTEFASVNSIDPDYYDLAGTRTIVPTDNWTVQRMFLMLDGTNKIQYGQAVFANELLALRSIAENFGVEEELDKLGIFKGHLICKRSATSVTNLSEVIYLPSDRKNQKRNVPFTTGILAAALGYIPANPTLPLAPPPHALAALPTASTNTNKLIVVTDAAGGAKLCISDGTVWKIVNTATTVS